MSVNPYAYRVDLDELRQTLVRAAAERDDRSTVENGELGWVLHERRTMHDAVNRLRARYGKPPVTEEAIVRVEMSATGHIDYMQKFALGAADLVHAD